MTRQWTGFGAPRDRPAAYAAWKTLAFFREDATPSLKARAYSSLAKCWLVRTHGKNLAKLDIDRLYDAGNNANQAIALGLVSDAALGVAGRIKSAGFRGPKDNRFPEYSTERFERLSDLWGALDARDAGVVEEKLKRGAKLSKDAPSYFCAAENCRIIVTKKYTLRSCAGRCPRALKPHYCSEVCQTEASFPSHSPNSGAYLSCRIGSVISHSADRIPQCRLNFLLTGRKWPPLSNDQIPKSVRSPKDTDEVQNEP